mgnify:CR=1 FL=1
MEILHTLGITRLQGILPATGTMSFSTISVYTECKNNLLMILQTVFFSTNSCPLFPRIQQLDPDICCLFTSLRPLPFHIKSTDRMSSKYIIPISSIWKTLRSVKLDYEKRKPKPVVLLSSLPQLRKELQTWEPSHEIQQQNWKLNNRSPIFNTTNLVRLIKQLPEPIPENKFALHACS